jgi:hypothetical protein
MLVIVAALLVDDRELDRKTEYSRQQATEKREPECLKPW